jgi:hypothetical protein
LSFIAVTRARQAGRSGKEVSSMYWVKAKGVIGGAVQVPIN